MAGFYGRVTNDSKTSMTFDRVYPNRITMDNSAQTDGVFSGRFVLVEYDSAIVDSDAAIGGSPETNTSGEYDYYTSFYTKLFNEGETPTENDIMFSTTTKSFLIHHMDLSNTKSDYSEYDTLTLLADGRQKNDIFKVYMLKYPGSNHWPDDIPASSIASNEHDRRRDAINTYVNENIVDVRYFMITDNPDFSINGMPSMNVPYKFTDVTELINTGESNAYNTNYNIDRLAYGTNAIGRGYDSTVWRKVIDTQGHHKYVMLAELNSVVPTFDLRADAPTNVPIAPHFGADLSNVYYPLHIQSGWGFRIARGTTGVDSDYTVPEYTSFEVNGNEIIQTPDSNFPDDYPGKIFFNKAGFNPQVSKTVNVGTDKNIIKMEPAASGKLYYGYDSNHSLQVADDIQELSIYLPAIGNIVSDMYDLMYGNSTEMPQGQRVFDTSWDDANARKDAQRVKSRALTYYKDPEHHIERDGFSTIEARSLAGTINSVHDMLGMIITEAERPEAAIDAYSNQIYCETNEDDEVTYYSVVDYPDYDPVVFENSDFNLTPEAFKDKFKDKEIAYPSVDLHKPSLVKYDGGKYLKIDDSPTYELAPAPKEAYGGAQSGKIYYDLPARLIYAGDMVASQENTGYSLASNGRDLEPDEDGIFVIHTHEGSEVYQIQPNTEFFHSGKQYYDYSSATGQYSNITPEVAQACNDSPDDPSVFEEFVSNGLYSIGEQVVKIISPSSSMYQIR
jgi:hypothetical protein